MVCCARGRSHRLRRSRSSRSSRDTLAACAASGEGEPIGPAPAQLEIVVEVAELCRLKLVEQCAERLDVVDGAECHEFAFHPELGVGQPQPGIEGRACEAHSFVSLTTKEQ